MDLFKILWEAFSINDCTMEELIEISALIDEEKSQSGCLKDSTDKESVIAGTVVALTNSRTTMSIGEKLDNGIKELIVQKNLNAVNLYNGVNLYKKIQTKSKPGTYKVKVTSNGCKFDLVASNGEILATSEVYSSIDSCKKGIMTARKNAKASIEDQTEEEYETISNPKYEIYCDRASEYRFRLKSMNGQVIMVSGGYKSKERCIETIKKVILAADSVDVEKN